MAKGKRVPAEEIITKLRQAEIDLAKGLTVEESCRKIGVTVQCYYRWRKKYGGLEISQAKQLKDYERENARLKRLVADQALDIAMLRDVASGKF